MNYFSILTDSLLPLRPSLSLSLSSNLQHSEFCMSEREREIKSDIDEEQSFLISRGMNVLFIIKIDLREERESSFPSLSLSLSFFLYLHPIPSSSCHIFIILISPYPSPSFKSHTVTIIFVTEDGGIKNHEFYSLSCFLFVTSNLYPLSRLTIFFS